ncbi:MAG: TonB C-terminal domain-containing protein [Deltaproteobacteria bacterium]|nr:TonB C-terminal domain-containing protein [Deltaproteobacteria bacterium]
MHDTFKRYLPYIIISLLIHFLALVAFNVWRMPDFANAEVAEAPIWVDLKNQKFEIADIEPPAKEEKPVDSRFLGMYDSATPEEQVAQWQGKAKQQGTNGKPKSAEQKQNAKKRENTPKDLLKFDKGIFASKEQSSTPKNFDDGTPGDALPEDFYPDFKRGNHTYLNVYRFPDIQYFVRLKRVFKMTFDPVPSLRSAYASNQITRGTVETVLGVSVDAKGTLAEIFIFRTSGIDSYDQESLRTIRASAPFSAPPGKLLDKEGLLRMSWTFTTYL